MGKHYNEACRFLVAGCSSHVPTLSGGDDQSMPHFGLAARILGVAVVSAGKSLMGSFALWTQTGRMRVGVHMLVFIRILWALHKNAGSAGRGPELTLSPASLEIWLQEAHHPLLHGTLPYRTGHDMLGKCGLGDSPWRESPPSVRALDGGQFGQESQPWEQLLGGGHFAGARDECNPGNRFQQDGCPPAVHILKDKKKSHGFLDWIGTSTTLQSNEIHRC